MPENVAAQPNVTPTPVVPTVDKFPDPTEQKIPEPQILNQTNQEVSTQLINKKFWRMVLLFLVLLPIITAVGIFGYQMYLTQSLSRQAIQPSTSQIDPQQVVTPEMLPLTNASELPAGWKRYTHPSAGYSFGYPQEWIIDDTDLGQVKLKSPSSVVEPVSFIFTVLPANQSVTTTDQIQAIVKELDKRQALKIGVATDSAKVSASGLAVYQREIAKGSNLLLYPEAFVALDRNLLQVSTEGNIGVQADVFDQVVQSIAVSTADLSGSSQWQSYENTFGYSLKYPPEVTLKSNDKNLADSADIAKSTNILVFPTSQIQNQGGFSNLLDLSLSDTEPPQSATQSATRDFGAKEFKKYDSEGKVHYVGQLSSGNWLQIALSFDSNVEERKLLNQVIDTITLKDSQQP